MATKDTHASWHPTENDIKNFRFGINIQAEWHGLDKTDQKIAEFLQQRAEVEATMMAEIRFLRNLLEKQ